VIVGEFARVEIPSTIVGVDDTSGLAVLGGVYRGWGVRVGEIVVRVVDFEARDHISDCAKREGLEVDYARVAGDCGFAS
jgi:hypothetical protein